MPDHVPQTTIVRIAVVAVFAALALATNYALIGIPNVKIMDALVFLAAFLFGLKVGVAVGASTWAVYGFINPQGSADLILLSFLITGECFYALAGAGLRKTAIARDLLENKSFQKGFSLVFGTVGLLTGAPSALAHKISTLVLFPTAAPAAIIAAKRFRLTQLTETSP